MKSFHPYFKIVLSLCLGLSLLALPAFSADIANVQLGSDSIHWQPATDAASWVLTVTGPEGFYVRQEFDSAPSMGLFTADGQFLADGLYKYELQAIPHISPQLRQELDAAAGDLELRQRLAARVQGLGGVQSGHFRISQGALVQGDQVELPAPGGGVTVPAGDLAVSQTVPEGSLDHLQVFNMDVLINGSLCVGFDCGSSQSFGFDTVRLRENNLRIHFDDTSSSGSFPSNDWRLTANDSANGGLSRFTVEDATAGRNVFTIEAGTISNALYVDSAGDVGIGTSSPVVEVHAVDGNTPTLRLEQNGSSGFTPQTWDLAGNETNFFIRDVTNGSRLPFKSRPGADTNSLVIEANGDVTMNGGNVGIGTGTGTSNAPDEALHIAGTDNPKVLIEDTTDNTNDKPGFTLRSPAATAGGDWFFEVDNGGQFQIDFGPSTGPEIVLSDTSATNSTVTINGNLMVNGTCTGCDAVFREGFELETIEEHAALMWEKSYLPSVGPTPEGKGLIDVFAKTTGILQELEKAHIYIEQLHGDLETKNSQIQEVLERVEALSVQNAALHERLESVEQRQQ